MDSATTEAVERKIQEWKEKLSGVNLSSRLLNFRKEKRSTVEFLVPASEIFQSLTKEISQSSSEEKNVLVVTSMKTQQEGKQLLKNLQQLLRDARATRRQRDMNPLFMALGSLTWTLKSKPDNPITSPIFLIPVELQKTRGKDEYKLIPTTELPIVNSVLIRKLETDHGINLGIEQGDKLWAYCELIEAVQSNKDIAQKVQESGWKILEQTSFLSLFERDKDSMIRDLEQYSQMFLDHPILQGLAGDWREYQRQIPRIYKSKELDYEIEPEKVFQVLESDSNQQVVIEAAKAGLSFVVQGPPGTGKSQTIVNIITELVAQGKKVLLVAEKSVALKVVFNRLEKSGLGDICLNLHDEGGVDKGNLTTVLQQTKDKLSKRDGKEFWDDSFFYQLRDLRRDLNQYPEVLHRSQPPLGKSAFDLYGELIRLEQQGIQSIDFTIPEIKNWSSRELFEAKKLINELGKFSHLFRGSSCPLWEQSNIRSVSEIHCVEDNILLD